MEKEKFIEEKEWEIQESIIREYSLLEEEIDVYDEYSEIITKAAEIIYYMKMMRDKYKEKKLLPVFPANSIWEDMIIIADYIEGQALLFGEPVIVKKSYENISKEEVNEIKKNPFHLSVSGLKLWVDEELI